jgi:hypothetical protein
VAYKVPTNYQAAISGSSQLTYTVDATYNGAPVAMGLQPSGGSVTDTITAGVRRTLNLELAPEPGLYEKLKPIGTRLTVSAHVSANSLPIVSVPMGVFDVDQESVTVGGAGAIKVTAPDKWQKIARAKFIFPASSNPALSVTAQITALIQGALGASEPVQVLTTKIVSTPALTWTSNDRVAAINDLAKGLGLWVYFDRDGYATIADRPTVASAAQWQLDLVSLDRTRDRSRTSNVVIVESSSASGSATFNPQAAWDQNSASPTYAGSDPLNHPELAGPFGVVPYHFSTPLPLQDYQALQTAQTILAVTCGMNAQITAGALPNPALDAYDAVDVLPPRERYDLPQVVERHFVETVTHPLTVDQPMHIAGLSSRTDGYM